MNHDLCCNSCDSSLLCQRNPDGKKQEEQKRGRVKQIIGLNIPDGVFSPSFVIQRIAVGDILRSIPAYPCK